MTLFGWELSMCSVLINISLLPRFLISPHLTFVHQSRESCPRARIPYNRGCFLPSLPSPEEKVLENLWFMGEGKGKRQISGGGARILVGVVKAVKAKNVGIV